MSLSGNRAMTSEEFYANYKIPEFQNKQEATIYGHKHHNEEPLRRLLKHRMDELLEIVKPYAGSLEPGNLKIVSYYMSQWEDCAEALRIMNEYHAIYKATKKEVDWAQTAKEPDYSIPYFKDMHHAATWAHERSFNPKLFRVLKNKLMNYELAALQNFRASDKQGTERMERAIDQFERLALVVTIFRDHRGRGKIGDNAMMNVGASVYAGSHPVER